MFSWLDKLDRKPDHPMSDAHEARRLLAELPLDNPLKALEEVTSWLETFKDVQGYQLEQRFAVASLLDETGQPYHAELLRQYLAEPHLQDFHGMRLWRVSHSFLSILASTYAVCADEFRRAEKVHPEIRARMVVISTRLIRAIAERMKLDLLRYIEVEPEVWSELYLHYRFAEINQCADTMVYAYSGHVIHTSPQRELMRALALYIASPATLSPDQIEVAYRIAARMVSLFDFRPSPHEGCSHYIDLAHPAAPLPLHEMPPATQDMRFFGTSGAIQRLDEIARQNERAAIPEERRFGSEFTPDGKLTVLRHLQLYWSKDHPHRHRDRRHVNAPIKIIHGFKVVSALVTHVELGRITNLSEADTAKLKMHTGSLGILDAEVDYATEDWIITDLSSNGIGGILPKTAGPWVKIGAICGISDQNEKQWWVGMVRRLHADDQGKIHVGIEILAKKPLSLWLRILGKGAERVSNWETSSGTFTYDYLPVILLPDEHNSYLNATILMEAQSYVTDTLYEMMLGEKSRNIKLTELIAEGDDYEQVKFQWMSPES